MTTRLDQTLDRGRDAAAQRMRSRCRVMRITDRVTQDETNGHEVPVWVEIYTGLPCRVGDAGGRSPSSRTVDLGELDQEAGSRVISLPVDASLIADHDLVDITDGENAGTVWQITESDWADQKTARRVPVLAVDRPREWA